MKEPNFARMRGARSGRRARIAAVPAGMLPPEDEVLREFIADLYAALAIMRVLRRQIARTLDLSSAQLSVLLAVWHLERRGDMTVKAIAAHLHVAAAYVTAEVGQLVEAGLLAKAPHPSDKRAVGIALTSRGRALFRRLIPMLREINDRLFEGLTRAEILRVRRFLSGIIEHGEDALRVTASYPRPATTG
jgi:DNA-binding MarR family transcriptional regulator